MAENEEDKVNATLLQNYSFHSASQVEYSESFSYTFTRNVNFKIVIGASALVKIGTNILKKGVFTEINETLTQENGGRLFPQMKLLIATDSCWRKMEMEMIIYLWTYAGQAVIVCLTNM